jgi:hypothetical protein
MLKWTYISKAAFLIPYFKTVIEIAAAMFYDIVHIFNKKTEKRLAKYKLLAFARFHLWLILKMPSNRYIPKGIN